MAVANESALKSSWHLKKLDSRTGETTEEYERGAACPKSD